MGDPRKIRRKYSGPRHPWKKARIEEEGKLVKEYGLKNKREIWQMASVLRDIRDQAKNLIAASGMQAERERGLLIGRLLSLGLVQQNAKLDDALGLTLQHILERRLQTVLVRKGLAKTMNQARQFITHMHVFVNNKVITRPSYLVQNKEEPTVQFDQQSTLANPEHPVRVVAKKESKESAAA